MKFRPKNDHYYFFLYSKFIVNMKAKQLLSQKNQSLSLQTLERKLDEIESKGFDAW